MFQICPQHVGAVLSYEIHALPFCVLAGRYSVFFLREVALQVLLYDIYLHTSHNAYIAGTYYVKYIHNIFYIDNILTFSPKSR